MYTFHPHEQYALAVVEEQISAVHWDGFQVDCLTCDTLVNHLVDLIINFGEPHFLFQQFLLGWGKLLWRSKYTAIFLYNFIFIRGVVFGVYNYVHYRYY